MLLFLFIFFNLIISSLSKSNNKMMERALWSCLLISNNIDLLATMLEFLNNLMNSSLASAVILFLITNIFSHSNTFSFIKLLNSSGISVLTVLHWINLVLPMSHMYDLEGYLLFFVISGVNFWYSPLSQQILWCSPLLVF